MGISKRSVDCLRGLEWEEARRDAGGSAGALLEAPSAALRTLAVPFLIIRIKKVPESNRERGTGTEGAELLKNRTTRIAEEPNYAQTVKNEM